MRAPTVPDIIGASALKAAMLQAVNVPAAPAANANTNPATAPVIVVEAGS